MNKDYTPQLASLSKQLGDKNGVLVYFQSITWRWYLPSEKELEEELGLSVLVREEDGSIYQVEKG